MDRAVAELIAKQLGVDDRLSMRLVCRFLRDALRDCFTDAHFSSDTPTLRGDALEAFPQLSSLTISYSGGSKDAWALLVARLVSSSPSLLSNVDFVTLVLDTWSASAVHQLASSCSKLQRIRVHHPHFKATFTGSGPDPAGHLQRQLTTPNPTATLLYPPSWAACHCLTDLHLIPWELAHPTDDAEPCASSLVHTTDPCLLHRQDPVSNCNLLRALPHLTTLTHLSVDLTDDDEDCFCNLHQAVPLAPQLRRLSLNSQQVYYEDTIAPGDSWARVTHLTHLSIAPIYVQLECLPPFSLLRHLRIALPDGHVTQLYPLTALTSLSLGDGTTDSVAEHYNIGSLTTDMPQQWRTGLKRLVWVQWGAALDNAALALLQGLTRLNIAYQTVTHEFAWALAKLPRLQKLKTLDLMLDKSIANEAPPPTHERPVLPSLVKVKDLSSGVMLVNLLAQWTQLPPSCRKLRLELGDDTGISYDAYQSLQRWSPGWLQALLCCRGVAGQGYPRELRLAFDCKEDVASFCAAAPTRLSFDWVHLYIGEHMPQAALAQLLRTIVTLGSRWSMSGSPFDTAQDTAGVAAALAAAQLTIVPGQHHYSRLLKQPLQLTRASVVDALPAGGLPNLVDLHLDIGMLDPAAMRALMAGTFALTNLRLSGQAKGLTADRLLPCIFRRQLQEVRMGCLGPDDKAAVQLVSDFMVCAADACAPFTLVWEKLPMRQEVGRALLGCPPLKAAWEFVVEDCVLTAVPKWRGGSRVTWLSPGGMAEPGGWLVVDDCQLEQIMKALERAL